MPFRAFEAGPVAVVGASDNAPLTLALRDNLRRFDPSVEVFPVNPRHASVWGEPTAANLRDIDREVGLVIVMTPPGSVEGVLRDSIECGVRSAVVYTAGFAELGPAGLRLQERIGDLARSHDLELWGPNCLGVISPGAGRAPLVVPTSSIPHDLRTGTAALVSQSGGLMLSTVELAARLGVGVRHAVATGNEAGVTSVGALELMLADPEVRVVGLILEGVRDGRRFLEAAEGAARAGKSLVALKLGRSAVGIHAVATHTAVAVGSGRVFDALCAEVGVHVVHTIAELVDGLAVGSMFGRAPGGGLAVLTISGGTSVLAADLAERFDIPLATLAEATRSTIRALVPRIATADNPLDVTTEMYGNPDVFGRCAAAVAADPNVGAVALVMHLRHSGEPPAHRALVASFWDAARGATKPFAVVSSIPEGVSGYWRAVAGEAPGPMLNGIDGLRAVAMLLPTGRRDPLTHDSGGPARHDADSPRVVTEVACYESILREVEVPIARYVLAQSPAEAARAADIVGFPVVLKVQSPDIPHRASVGAIRFDVASAEEAARAYAELLERAARTGAEVRIEGVLLQQQVASVGAPILVGTTLDPGFGAVTSIGLGGAFAEAGAPLIRRAPMSPAAATAAIAELLEGLPHGLRLPMDDHRDSLARAIAAISTAACAAIEAGEVTEFEVNPLLLTAGGPVIVDALGIDRTGSR